ncbi:MAG TPA: prenyltransferase [Pilimelia sp.]|nr:prenyltransferase [Pilimelia sp.]
MREHTAPGVLTAADVAQTADTIAAAQAVTGQIPWFPGGHTDPWDHVEAAMALDVAGRHDEARAAYDWLRRSQNPDGSWCHTYEGERVVDATRESNFAAYIAVGLWHHFQATGDDAFLDRMWPTLCAALSFVMGLQAPGGEIRWARGPDGAATDEALLTGCASMYHSLRCALAIADRRGESQPDWELTAATLGHAVAAHPERFSPRDRYSMDWYYPILGGAVRGEPARRRIDAGWDRFVVPGLGVRCVSDRPWVTGAETCELVLALCAMGEHDRAADLFAAVQRLRHDDGSYWTGYVYPDDAMWPVERTTWTAGAVLLAAAALAGDPPATTAVFGGGDLPAGPAETVAGCGLQHP